MKSEQQQLRLVAIPVILAGIAMLAFFMLGTVETQADQRDESDKHSTPIASGIEKAEELPPSNPWPAAVLTYAIPGSGNPAMADVGFISETEFETINGHVSVDKAFVNGSFDFSGEELTGKGEIIVDIAGMRTGNSTRDEHMLGWLGVDEGKPDSKKIVFKATDITHINHNRYAVKGTMTIKGKTVDHALEMTIKYLPPSKIDGVLNAWKDENKGKPWVSIEGTFHVSRKAHGVAAPSGGEIAEKKVADEWRINVKLRGRSETKTND